MNLFKEFGLREEILKAIHELGFEEPTTIQSKTIPAIIRSGEDIIALAQTGTGKTAGFGLPIIQQLMEQPDNRVQALILCPTRELCMQICKDLESFSKFLGKVSSVAVYGGSSIVPQIKSVKAGVQIVVGTPGRTLDLLKRKVLKIGSLRWMVLDEADEMLNMGFRDDLDAILASTPDNKQTLLFSATMPDGVRKIAQNYMHAPLELEAGKRNTGAENVEHHYYVVKAIHRYIALKRLADINPNIYGIVFCRTRSETKEVADKLIQDGYNADALHGDLSQAQRDHVMSRFRSKHLQMLVATDVAARGIDVTDLTHIINYNLPDDPEVYIHRSGRTGRAGKKGISNIISHSREGGRIRDLEKLVGKKFILKQIPGGKDICEKRLYNLVDKLEHIHVDETQIEPFLPAINKKLEWMDRDELLKRFVSVEFNRFLEYYKNAEDINVSEESTRPGKNRNRNINYTRFYINLGSKQKLNASGMLGLINDKIRQRNAEVGKIDILRNFSFFEINNKYETLVLKGFEGATYGGAVVSVKISKPDKQKESNYMGYTNRKNRNRKKNKTRKQF